MYRRFFTSMFSIIVCAAAVCQATAQQTVVDAITYTVINDSEAALTDGTEFASAELTVPATVTINGVERKVTAIGDIAFSHNNKIKKVELPASITSIGASAFSHTDISGIDLPEGLLVIGDGAFRNSGLASVAVPESVISLGSEAFYATSLTEAVIKCKLKTVPFGLFDSCSRLTKVSLPAGVERIEQNAFALCRSLTEINLSADIKHIGKDAFANCGSLSGITLPAGLEELGEGAFRGCALTDAVIPSDIKVIPLACFNDCKNLVSLSIPEGVERINAYAFNDCGGIRTLSLPASLNYLGTDAFAGTSITLLALNTPNEFPGASFEGVFGKQEIASMFIAVPDTERLGSTQANIYAEQLKAQLDDKARIRFETPDDMRLMVDKPADSAAGERIAVTSENLIYVPSEATVGVRIDVQKPEMYVVTWNDFVNKENTLSADNITFTAPEADGVTGLLTVSAIASVEGLHGETFSASSVVTVYSADGLLVADKLLYGDVATLPAGLYIVRGSDSVRKVMVK